MSGGWWSRDTFRFFVGLIIQIRSLPERACVFFSHWHGRPAARRGRRCPWEGRLTNESLRVR
jgi:hypothetical protein